MKWLISFWIHSVESSYCAEYALKNILESKNLNPQNQLRRKSSIDKSLSFHSSSELLTIFWFVRLDFSHQSDIGTCKRVRCSKQCLTNRRIDALSKREVFFDSFMHLLWEQNLAIMCSGIETQSPLPIFHAGGLGNNTIRVQKWSEASSA